MSVLYVALPITLLIAGAALAAFAWTLRTGQLDDLETPPYRAIFDDVPKVVKQNESSTRPSPPLENRFAPNE